MAVRSPDGTPRGSLACTAILVTRSGQRAAVAVPSLRWLRERVDTIKDLDAGEPVSWDKFPWQEWHEHRDRALAHLKAIWDGLPSDEES